MSEERRIPLRGTFNFRDLGGYLAADGRTVRRGRIYRSDNLSRLATSEFARFSELGIRLIVDLRTPGERARRPNRLPPGHAIRTEHLPISLLPALEQANNRWGLAWTLLRAPAQSFPPDLVFSMYRDLRDNAAPALRRLFELLADEQHHPALIMCAGGKDRTGFASAMLLLALGVPEDVVTADYALTGQYMAPLVDRVVRNLRVVSLFRVRDENIRPLMLARPEYLAAALDVVRARDGDVNSYIAGHIQVSGDALKRLRGSLLAP